MTKKSSYKVLDIKKTFVVLDGETVTKFIARVQWDKEPQPFEFEIERFDTAEEARECIRQWIQLREHEESVSEKNKKEEDVFNELKSDLI